MLWVLTVMDSFAKALVTANAMQKAATFATEDAETTTTQADASAKSETAQPE